MKVKCNYCDALYEEEEIVINEDGDEICPYCHTQGCLMDMPETEAEYEEINLIMPPYGYKPAYNDVGELQAYCQKCGRRVGSHIKNYGWVFGSTVDFGDSDNGLCDQCYEEEKK